MEELAGFVLAAGSGTRLQPLTGIRPKALCPINNVPLVDLALGHVRAVTSDISVNAWHHSEQMIRHLNESVRLSVEAPRALGTAGALAAQKSWIAGRGVLVHNSDAWHKADLRSFVDGWDGRSVRLLVVKDPVRPDFAGWRFCGVSLMPWSEVERIPTEPCGLWEVSWKRLHDAGQLELVPYDGPYFDCGTPADYLAANLTASGGTSVVGEGARVQGRIERSVIWPGAQVQPGECLIEVIRAGSNITVAAGVPSAPAS